MGQFAVAEDVASRFEGTLNDAQLSWVDVKILDAEALLVTHIPRLSTLELVTSNDMVNARRIVSDAVLRVLRNPAGIQQEEAGPWRVVRDKGASSGALFFTPEELAVFRQVRRRRIGMLGVAPPRYSGEEL